ncbi:MAG: hypothetical protein IJK33_06555 [Clostridia bacterium]|nr:hypothetical protein [Clostridia bacterium]
MKKLLASVIAFAMLLTLCAVFASAEDSYEKIFDLGEEKVILSVTYTPANAEGLSKVTVLGSADGENFFKLNAEADVAVTDGAATFTLEMSGGKHRAFLNIRYIKVVGAADVEGEIAYTTVELPEGAEAIDPAGPYAVTGLNDGGYGAAVFTAADAPEGGFEVNAQDAFTSNDKAIKLNSSMITIAEKQDDGKYKILWNDSNGWTAETGATHTNSPEGAAGVTYQDGKVVLQENQILMVVMSSGGYETANDGIYSTLKWVLRGQSAGDVFSLTESGDGYSLTLGAGEAVVEPVSEPETSEPAADEDPDAYLVLVNDGSGSAPCINYAYSGDLLNGNYTVDVEALVCFEGCEGEGSVYLNCYPYNGSTLLSWQDYATHKSVEAGVWTKVEKTGWVLSKDGLDPDTVSMGLGFWNATGTIKVAYIKVSQNGEVIWSVDFADGLDLDAEDITLLQGITEDNKGTAWYLVGVTEPVEESTPAEESKPVTPTTGDAGIIALAVVSVLALGGAVIVKKSK